MKDCNLKNRPIKVMCIETGEIFPSIRKATKHAHRNHTQDIKDCCDGVRDSIDGCHYKWVDPIVYDTESGEYK